MTHQLQTEEKERAKTDLVTKIEDLTRTMTIEAVTADIERLNTSESQMQVKRAGEGHEKQNKEFQMTVADQQA